MTHPNINNLDDYKLLNMQNYLLFAVGAAAVNAGLLFPKIPALTDTLIIFSIALSIAVISISLCSSKTSELKNFPLPAIAAVAVSILSFLASVKLILIGNTAGPVIKLISRLDIVTELVPNYLSVLFFAAVSVTLMFLTIKFTRTLSKNIKNHIEEIKIIEQTRQESPIKEKRFFYGVYAFGRFSFWLAITCFAAVALSFFIASLAGKTTISLVAATGILMQSIMLFTVLAVANLTHRLGAKFSQQYKMTEEQFQEQIKVDTISEEKVDDYKYRICNEPLFDCGIFQNESSCDILTNHLIETGSCGSLILAASDSQSLPVTVPVDIAARLAETGRKTLLIDFDLKSSSVQKVFEINNCETHAVKTRIENISVISGRHLTRANFKSLHQILNKSQQLYDCTILYCPDAEMPSQAAEYFNSAMLFGRNEQISSRMQNLIKELNRAECWTVAPENLLQPA
ncbi:MAG: hypothetical protein WC962_01375 [Phycisphaerae bacterium]|jgi:hypothetical protein